MAVTQEKTQQEPSMEDILSSIRRIIASDGEALESAEDMAEEAAAPAPEPEPEPEASEDNSQDDIDALFDEPAPAEAQPEAEAAGADVLDLTEKVEDEPEPEPEPEPDMDAFAEAEEVPELELVEAEEPMPEPVSPVSEGLVSAGAEAASVAALSGLTAALRREAGEATFGGRSVEEIAAALLKPMLREWLDQNLPGMVESLVRAEIQRIAGQAGR